MQLVEQYIIRTSDPRYEAIDRAAFASKNLYNLANYHMRQSFLHRAAYLGYAEVYHLVKQTDAYTALPRKVSRPMDWRLFLVFGEALVNWGKPATLSSHLLRRGGKDANDSAVSPSRGTRNYVNQ
jgi:hypothetical protein